LGTMTLKWLRKRRSSPSAFAESEAGTVAVEFIILFPLFLLLVAGIVEFGHLWYVDHVITNAAREGARAGVVYPNTTAQGNTAAQNAITSYLTQNGQTSTIIPGVYPKYVTINISPVTDSNGDTCLQVRIQATHVAVVLGKVIPAFNFTLTTTTTMRMENQ
jgi:Flp pilus assembly protein TadG